MASVAQVAKAAGVSQAAVRARLADGGLAGRQVDRGQRRVWVVDDAAAAAYIAVHRGDAGSVPASASEPAQEPAPVGDGRVEELWPTSGRPRSGSDVAEQLTLENERLRAALSALTRAHYALVELVDVTYSGVPRA